MCGDPKWHHGRQSGHTNERRGRADTGRVTERRKELEHGHRELGEDAEIKKDNRKECLYPRSGCLNGVKFAQIARWELKLEKLRECKETIFCCMPSSFLNKRGQEESVNARALFMAAPRSHTVSDIGTAAGSRPRQSRKPR